MPLSYEIDQEHRLVITTAWDIVSAHEALELQDEIRSDTRLSPDFLRLVDLTRLTSVDVDINVMNELAARQRFTESRRDSLWDRTGSHTAWLACSSRCTE